MEVDVEELFSVYFCQVEWCCWPEWCVEDDVFLIYFYSGVVSGEPGAYGGAASEYCHLDFWDGGHGYCGVLLVKWVACTSFLCVVSGYLVEYGYG